MYRIFIALMLVSMTTSVATAEYRRALVIGVGKYLGGVEYPAGTHTIKLVGDKLRQRGFLVTECETPSTYDLDKIVREFVSTIPARGTAMIYFTGLAAQGPKGGNHLFCTNQNIAATNIFHAKNRVTYFLQLLRDRSGSSANILIVDGYYRHPKFHESMKSGPVRVDQVPEDGLIIHATPFGQPQTGSPDAPSEFARTFTAALDSDKPFADVIKMIATPGSSQSNLVDPDFQRERLSVPVSGTDSLANGSKPGDEWINNHGMIFKWCPPGSFTMGSPDNELNRENDESPVDVTFERGFWMGKYEYTRRDSLSLTGRMTYLSTGRHPAEPLNKFRKADPANWIKLLNETAPSGWEYALPTESEWEYAARAGTTGAYSFGDNPVELAKYGNFADRTLRESDFPGEYTKMFFEGDHDREGYFTHAHKTWSDGHAGMCRVGSFPPNAWGLHDVHGNLYELTSTPYHAERKPEKLIDHIGNVSRGGSWVSTPAYCRSAFRNHFPFRARENDVPNHTGLRFILKRRD